jgi:hypothetical protein
MSEQDLKWMAEEAVRIADEAEEEGNDNADYLRGCADTLSLLSGGDLTGR